MIRNLNIFPVPMRNQPDEKVGYVPVLATHFIRSYFSSVLYITLLVDSHDGDRPESVMQ